MKFIAPCYPQDMNGHQPFALETILRVHFMQQWFALSDPSMEETFFDVQLYRELAQLQEFDRLSDEIPILRFRHRLEKHELVVVNELLAQRGGLKVRAAVDAALITAPSSGKNKDRARDPERHSSHKGKKWHFGMKTHIGVDADLGLVHTGRGTSGNVAYVTEGHSPQHGEDAQAHGDAGDQGLHKRANSNPAIAMRKALSKDSKPIDSLISQVEKIKTSIRTKVEYPFRMIKLQFDYTVVRYQG